MHGNDFWFPGVGWAHVSLIDLFPRCWMCTFGTMGECTFLWQTFVSWCTVLNAHFGARVSAHFFGRPLSFLDAECITSGPMQFSLNASTTLIQPSWLTAVKTQFICHVTTNTRLLSLRASNTHAHTHEHKLREDIFLSWCFITCFQIWRFTSIFPRENVVNYSCNQLVSTIAKHST